jgi:hypothetical protein
VSSIKKITALSPGQEKRLAAVYEEWLTVGRNCAPLDRKEVTEICADFYGRIGKPAPQVLFFSSPMMCVLAWGLLRGLAESQLRSQLGSQLGSQLWSQLGSQLESQLWSQLRSQLGSQLGSEGIPTHFAAQHWCAWEVFYAFCGEIGVAYPPGENDTLQLRLRQSRAMHWWFPFEGIVLASERHTELHLDDQGRLHSPDQLACAYSDGWGVHSWHGVIIPNTYYEQPVSAKSILAERNIEVRRALIERYDGITGRGNFILDAGAKLIDSQVQPMREGQPPALNELLAIELPEDPDGRMVALRVIDPSTGRSYIIRVPPDQRTVQSALAWTFGVTSNQYKLIQQS